MAYFKKKKPEKTVNRVKTSGAVKMAKKVSKKELWTSENIYTGIGYTGRGSKQSANKHSRFINKLSSPAGQTKLIRKTIGKKVYYIIGKGKGYGKY